MPTSLELLSAPARQKLEQALLHSKIKKGEVVYRIGDQPKGLYFVLSGLIGLTLHSETGSEHLLRLFRKGDVFGHRSMFAGESYHATAIGLEPTELGFISKSVFNEIASQHCEIFVWLLGILSHELGQAETNRVLLTEGDVLSRTASAVVYLRELHPNHTWTRQEIASFCASTTPSVIRALAELESRGVIRQEGRKIEILDRQKLLEISK